MIVEEGGFGKKTRIWRQHLTLMPKAVVSASPRSVAARLAGEAERVGDITTGVRGMGMGCDGPPSAHYLNEHVTGAQRTASVCTCRGLSCDHVVSGWQRH